MYSGRYDKPGTTLGDALAELRKAAARRTGDHVQVFAHNAQVVLNQFDLMAERLAHLEAPSAPLESPDVRVAMPLHITSELIEAVTAHPNTSVEDKDQRHLRIGWLVCAYDVMVDKARGLKPCTGGSNGA